VAGDRAPDGWVCTACGKSATQVTRLFCATCLEHHEVCFDCAPDVEIDGRPVPIREALKLIGAQLGVDASRERLLIASTGEIALPHEPGKGPVRAGSPERR
jgi:hypothetical protein